MVDYGVLSDGELVRLASRGDSVAVKAVYDRYVSCLAAVCARYIADDNDRKDVLQECFIRIFTSLGKFEFRGEGSLKAWLSRVMVNTALEYLRKNGKINQVLTLDEIPDIVDPESESDDLERIPQDVLMNFISELPSGYRTVFNLYTFEEKSHKEIADLLKISEKTSSSQLYRARIILAKKIKKYLMETDAWNKKIDGL